MSDLTLEDIARLAGVSRSTVSRVINNHPSVRGSVRTRVLEVIQNTGFHPNLAARALVSKRSWMLGLVVPRSVSSFFTDPYFPFLTQGIAQACNQHNFTLGFFLVSTKEDEDKIFPRVSRKGYLDGIIVQSGQIGEGLIDRLNNADIPLVIAGRPLQPNNLSYVDVDNVTAAAIAVNHLIGLGYARIATITGPVDNTVGIDRRAGYEQALAQHGLPVEADLMVAGDFTEPGGYAAMKKLLPTRPRAVFAASDGMAIGAMRAIQSVGLRVPQDIAVVGFDDLPMPTPPTPLLTTMRQPIQEFGARAVEVLIDLIENGNLPPRKVIMTAELIIRDSCGSAQMH